MRGTHSQLCLKFAVNPCYLSKWFSPNVGPVPVIAKATAYTRTWKIESCLVWIDLIISVVGGGACFVPRLKADSRQK